MTEERSVRDQIRSGIFSKESKTPDSRDITFFGQEIRIRQPDIGTILEYRNRDDRKEAMIEMIIMFAYVPDTNDRVFEPADKDSILGLPFGKDFSALNSAITELTTVDLESAEKNSEEIQVDST